MLRHCGTDRTSPVCSRELILSPGTPEYLKRSRENSWTPFLRVIMLALAVQPAPAGVLACFLLENHEGISSGK